MKFQYPALVTSFCGALLAAATTTATAEERTGIYLGGSLGYSFVEAEDDIDFDDRVEEFDVDDEDFAWKGFVGYQFLPWLGIEVGYVDFGEVEDGTAPLTVESTVDGWDAFLVGNLPVGPVDLFAKAGMISWDLEVDFSDGVNDDSFSNDGEDLAYGVGAAIELGQIAIRAEAERFDIDDVDDLYMLSLGASVHF